MHHRQPEVLAACHIRVKREDSIRPIKVNVTRSERIRNILDNVRQLRSCIEEKHKRIFLQLTGTRRSG